MTITSAKYAAPDQSKISLSVDGQTLLINPIQGLYWYDTLVQSGLQIGAYEPTSDDVNAERDRRMSAFVFGGKTYDLQGQSLANVSGAGTLALAAIINGAQVGNLRWADPDADFTWIANDNTMTPMDAQTTWAFAQTAAAWRKHCIFKARTIKDMTPIPANYTADSYWE